MASFLDLTRADGTHRPPSCRWLSPWWVASGSLCIGFGLGRPFSPPGLCFRPRAEDGVGSAGVREWGGSEERMGNCLIVCPDRGPVVHGNGFLVGIGLGSNKSSWNLAALLWSTSFASFRHFRLQPFSPPFLLSPTSPPVFAPVFSLNWAGLPAWIT